MGKLYVFAVYDSKVQSYDKPFFMRSRGEALRGWQTAANDEQTTICTHPEDFSLMELGSYDSELGAFTNNSAPVNLGLASQFKNAPATQAPLFDANALGDVEAHLKGSL